VGLDPRVLPHHTTTITITITTEFLRLQCIRYSSEVFFDKRQNIWNLRMAYSGMLCHVALARTDVWYFFAACVGC
jgi:hypothetical protein